MIFFTKKENILLKFSMDDDDEDNPTDDKCQKYWIPGLKTIGEFLLLLLSTLLAKSILITVIFREKSV